MLDHVHNYAFRATPETKLMVNTNDSVNFKCPASDKLKVYMVSERHYTSCEIEEG